MSRRHQLRMLAEVGRIRQAQRLTAERGLADAQAHKAAAVGRRDEKHAELAAAEANWVSSLGRRFGPELPTAWSEEVARVEVSLSVAVAAAVDAEGRRDRAEERLRAALAQEAAVERVHKAARRDMRRRSEEAALAEAADRGARRGSAR